MTLDTKAFPDTPESSAEIARLREGGWRVTGRSHGTVRLARTVGDVPTPSASTRAEVQDAEAPSQAAAPVGASARADDAARAEVVAELGVRVADALAGHGFYTLQHARSAYAAAPESFAGLAGIGPATLAKLG